MIQNSILFGRKVAGKIFRMLGVDLSKILSKILHRSLFWSAAQQDLNALIGKLREIEPDISNQESSGKEGFNQFWEQKRRALQAFQCNLMLDTIKLLPKDKTLKVVDIGDSAGTHMLYLKALDKSAHKIETLGVNLDPNAIAKIQARGQKALLCRAEDLDLRGILVDLFVSFQMVEHLHNPSIFFRRLTRRSSCNRMIITVPYLQGSRVGLHTLRIKSNKKVSAEEEHIFELSPKDWELLLLHSGWKVLKSKTYYQYPLGIPILSKTLANLWKKFDFEGFWGAILEKDTSSSDLYQNWEE